MQIEYKHRTIYVYDFLQCNLSEAQANYQIWFMQFRCEMNWIGLNVFFFVCAQNVSYLRECTREREFERA